MSEQKTTYQILEKLGRELKKDGILEVPYVKEELDIIKTGIEKANPNTPEIFRDRYTHFAFLFDVMLSADGVKELYIRAVAGKKPQLLGLDSTTKFKIIDSYNQRPFRIFDIVGWDISLRQKIPNLEWPNILRTALQRVRDRNSIYSYLTKELQPYIENFENELDKIREDVAKKEYDSATPDKEKVRLRRKMQTSEKIYSDDGIAGI